MLSLFIALLQFNLGYYYFVYIICALYLIIVICHFYHRLIYCRTICYYNMPRVAKVSVEDAVRVVKNFAAHFITNDLPPYSSKVWMDMSMELNGVWTAHDIYMLFEKIDEVLLLKQEMN